MAKKRFYSNGMDAKSVEDMTEHKATITDIRRVGFGATSFDFERHIEIKYVGCSGTGNRGSIHLHVCDIEELEKIVGYGLIGKEVTVYTKKGFPTNMLSPECISAT